MPETALEGPVSPLRALLVLTVLALIPLTICYAAACQFSPVRSCRHCHGHGRHPNARGRLTYRCHRCKGTGVRVRLGRLLWAELRRTHHRGTR